MNVTILDLFLPHQHFELLESGESKARFSVEYSNRPILIAKNIKCRRVRELLPTKHRSTAP